MLAFVIATGALTMPAHAQVQLGPAPDATFGVGGQIGDPSGVSLKFYEQPGIAWDLLLAFDLSSDSDFVFFNAHRVWERPIEGTPLRYYYGPGGFVGFDDGPGDDDDDVVLGGSFTLGLTLFIERVEIFANLTPRLRLLPATDGGFGGGLGLRYYF